MKLEHLGKIVDIEPRHAAIENRIVRMLGKHHDGLRQNKLLVLVNAGKFGVEAFNQACDRLTEEGLVTRVSTNWERSFLLKLTPWGEHQALDCEEMIAGRKDLVA